MRISTVRSYLVVAGLVFVTLPAAAQLPVEFGTTWDGAGNSLQNIVDARYGVGSITVTTDYIGADAGDPDPFYWTGLGFDAFLVREVAGYANVNTLGWYQETGAMPLIDGTDDGVVFTGPMSAGQTTLINFAGAQPFGFYLNPNGTGNSINAPEPELFFSNRLFNDLGPDGSGAIHAPFDGDVQAIVFDVSSFTLPNTWLVCFEDLDSGAIPAPCCTPTDNDFNDLVFEVQVLGAVPVKTMTFGAIKKLYGR